MFPKLYPFNWWWLITALWRDGFTFDLAQYTAFLVTTLGILQNHSRGRMMMETLMNDKEMIQMIMMFPLPYLCENYWSISLAAEYGWYLLIFWSSTSLSCVCSQLVMSICSRGRLLQQQEQGQLASWVTSSQENSLQNFSYLLLVFVCMGQFSKFYVFGFFSGFFSLLSFCHHPAGS